MKKILIANRAEIASRIIRTCKGMGIATIAVYSEYDKDLPFVYQSDEAYSLGSGSATQTYLDIPKIIAIAQQSRADAIHPGYGFLSENAAFCKAVEAVGLTFIGPSAEVIALMGDKIASRRAVEEIGVPLIPGYNGEKQDAGTLQREAGRIGYPVLIKASAGGGGKGMRVVERPADFAALLEAAQSEAQNAFGDARVFIERYITRPRHIEVQVFSDTHGNHVHLFERECSIQRRHQKIVEESPSPALDAGMRQRICDTAVSIARHIGYRGAGTVEFIYDANGGFYFLEMNTRLQVEHPVTEMVTGQDLVAWQIRVARGEALPLAQSEIRCNGHAMEVRLYAEDPDNGFLPTVGTIETVGNVPNTHARLDNGYEAGNAVTIHYDPMLAKLAASGGTRKEAAQRLVLALRDVLFAGVKTNRAYLTRVLQHPTFLAGETHTGFVVEHAEALAAPAITDDEVAAAIAAYVLTRERYHMVEDTSPWNDLTAFRNVI